MVKSGKENFIEILEPEDQGIEIVSHTDDVAQEVRQIEWEGWGKEQL